MTKEGRPKRKTGPKVLPEEQKTERLAFRVHRDLLSLLDMRAAEAGIKRSQYVEKLLIGWLRADPRNRRLELRSGRFDPNAMSPEERRLKSGLGFLNQQSKFNDVYQILLGTEVPKRFFRDPDDVYEPGDEGD